MHAHTRARTGEPTQPTWSRLIGHTHSVLINFSIHKASLAIDYFDLRDRGTIGVINRIKCHVLHAFQSCRGPAFPCIGNVSHTIGLRYETYVLLSIHPKKGTKCGLNTGMADRGPSWPLVLNCLLNNNTIFYTGLTPPWHCLGNVQYLHSYHNSILAQLHSKDVQNW